MRTIAAMTNVLIVATMCACACISSASLLVHAFQYPLQRRFDRTSRTLLVHTLPDAGAGSFAEQPQEQQQRKPKRRLISRIRDKFGKRFRTQDQKRTDQLVKDLVQERSVARITSEVGDGGPVYISISSKEELNERLAQAASQNKLVAVFYHASWCRSCHASLTRLRAMIKHRFSDLRPYLVIVDWQVDKTKNKSKDNDFPNALPHVRMYHPTDGLIDDRSAVKSQLQTWGALVRSHSTGLMETSRDDNERV